VRLCGEPLRSLNRRAEQLVARIVERIKATPNQSVSMENRTDHFFHTVLASLPNVLFALGRQLKTEVHQLSWNLIYILAPFVLLLVIMMFWLA
jgi:hypothetical protein